MANVLKHRFASGKANGPDATQIQPSHWNDGHIFSGGNANDILTRDPTDASFGAKWAAPPAALSWTDIAYSASNFSGSGSMIWTVTAGNVVTLGYQITGRIANVIINIGAATSVSGTRDSYLMVNSGLVAFRSVDAVAKINDNGTQLVGLIRIFVGESLIRFHKADGSTWNLSSGTTGVFAQFAYPV